MSRRGLKGEKLRFFRGKAQALLAFLCSQAFYNFLISCVRFRMLVNQRTHRLRCGLLRCRLFFQMKFLNVKYFLLKLRILLFARFNTFSDMPRCGS